jgi:hypothetical protein
VGKGAYHRVELLKALHAMDRLLSYYFTRVSSNLTRKSKTRLERPARDKHSNLVCTFVNYSCIKLYYFRLNA